MKIYDPGLEEKARFQALVAQGVLSNEALDEVVLASACRHIDAEWILRYEHNIPRRRMLEALGEYYGCAWVEYDERRPVPADLLAGLDGNRLCLARWFPVIRDGETVVIAASDPHDPEVMAEARMLIPAQQYEFRVALADDILAFIQDYLNSPPEHLIGNERTGLAYWRNTMSRWRTRLACYRTDFSMARTHFSILRGGLGMISIGGSLLRVAHPVGRMGSFYWGMIAAGFLGVIFGLISYLRLKQSIMSPPKHQTLIEVTAATLYFLENYQFLQSRPAESPTKATMLARLNDLLPNNCVFIEPSLDNKVRSYLAHERTSLAAQRTVAACYRTIYSRARTGLSFIRTGVSFSSIGIALFSYFGLSKLNLLDGFLILAGILLVVDGVLWYWPVRKERREALKCPVIV